MICELDRGLQKLGGGTPVTLASGETIFKLDSFENNPIVKPQDMGLTWYEDGELRIGAVFNGGAEVFRGQVILAPRCHRGYRKVPFRDEALAIARDMLEDYVSEVWLLVSQDGVHFTRFKNVVIRGDGTDHQDFTYGLEDVRIVESNEKYLLVGCGKIKPPFKGSDADRIAIYSTDDLVKINYHGMVASFDSRNAVPFPEPIAGRHYMLFRFHPSIHLDILEAGLDQLLNPSQYVEKWERIYERRGRNLLLEAGRYPHEGVKIGAGTPLIKADRGWLLIYHAVGKISNEICKAYGLSNEIERGYSICAALLDPDDPHRVLRRSRYPIYIPSAPYELYGNEEYPVDVPAVVFPAGALVRRDKLILYAGAGDKYVVLLSCNLNSLVDYLWSYGEVID